MNFKKIHIACLFAILSALTALNAFAQTTTGENFVRAKALFTQGSYAEAIAEFEALVASPDMKDTDKIIECHQYLGAAHFYLKNEEASRKYFLRLLAIRPEYEMDPLIFPPDLIAFLERIKGELQEKLEFFKEQQRKLEEERLIQLEQERKRQEEARRVYIVKHERKLNPIVNWIPFGAGQFQNEHIAKGIAFGVMQIAGLIMNVVAYHYAQALRNERGYYNTRVPPGKGESDYSKAKEAIVWQYIGLGLFSAGYIVSVSDSLYHYEPTIMEIRTMSGEEFRKEMGEEIPASLTPLSFSNGQ